MKISTKLRQGDEVIVISGSCKGKTGKITELNRKKARVVVDGVNLGKRHVRPSQSNPDGGVVEFARSLPISNVAFLDPAEKKATRLCYRTEDGKKMRVAVRSGTVLS